MAASTSNAPAATEGTSAELSRDLANTILEAIKSVDDKVSALSAVVTGHGEEIVILRRAVHGSDPPPGDGALPIARQASEASLDVASLRTELADVRAELAKQSSAMGIGVRGLKWLASKDGRTTVLRVATAFGSTYAALHAAGLVR